MAMAKMVLAAHDLALLVKVLLLCCWVEGPIDGWLLGLREKEHWRSHNTDEDPFTLWCFGKTKSRRRRTREGLAIGKLSDTYQAQQ